MKQKRDLYFLFGATLILVVFWVMFSIYQNLISSTISSPVATDINPISPSFKEEVLTTLKKRQQVSPLYTPIKIGGTLETQVSTESSQSNSSTQSAQTKP